MNIKTTRCRNILRQLNRLAFSSGKKQLYIIIINLFLGLAIGLNSEKQICLSHEISIPNKLRNHFPVDPDRKIPAVKPINLKRNIKQLEFDSNIVLSDEEISIRPDYIVNQPDISDIPIGCIGSYSSTARTDTPLPLLKATNESGLSLYFIYNGSFSPSGGAGTGQYGARLLKAVLNGQDLLYVNPATTKTNWGPIINPGTGETQGWPSLGGVESAFPVDEHGYYSAMNWNYKYFYNPDGSFTYEVSYTGDPACDGSQRLQITVTYTLPEQGEYWKISTTATNPDNYSKSYQYWQNLMVPAGNDASPDEIQTVFSNNEVSTVEIHSTGDQEYGGWPDGEHTLVSWEPNGKISKIHGPQGTEFADTIIQGWAGYFNYRADGGETKVSREGIYNISQNFGLGIVSAEENSNFYPKLFGGPGIDSGIWTDDNSRYIEMWYSPVNRTFWNEDAAAIEGNQTWTNKVVVFPFSDIEDFHTFQPPQNLYVSPDGVNNPDYGTSSQPFKTISYALSQVQQTPYKVIISGGEYDEAFEVPQGGTIQGGWNNTFTEFDPWTYRTQITGRNWSNVCKTPNYCTQPKYSLLIDSNTTIEGLFIKGRGDLSFTASGIFIKPNTTNFAIRNCEIIDYNAAIRSLFSWTHESGNGIIEKNLIHDNLTGIALSYMDNVKVLHNTIAKSTVYNYDYGYGILIDRSNSNISINYNIVAGHGTQAGGYRGIHISMDKEKVSLNFNDIYTNINYSPVNTLHPTDINKNPLFTGDFRLQEGSPCIDATDEPGGEDGDNDGISITDIGTFEYKAVLLLKKNIYLNHLYPDWIKNK